LTSRRRRERDALGGTLEPYYPRYSPDPYTGHLPAEVGGSDDMGAGPSLPPKAGIGARIRRRLGAWRRAWLPLPDEIIEEYLGHGERMIHNDHPSFRAFVIQHGILVIALLVAAGLFVGVVLNGSFTAMLLTFLVLTIVLFVLVLQRLSERYTSYVITNVRIMRVAGVVTRRVHSIPWMRVTDLTFDQSSLGRILGYATLHIESANEDSGLRDLAGVSDPMVFNKYLVDMVVAKQGPIAPGWEELGQAGPAGVISAQQRVGLRDRVREIRRRRREQRAAEAGLEVPMRRRRRRVPATGADTARRPPPAGGEPGPYGDPRRIYVSEDDVTRQLEGGGDEGAGAASGDTQARDRDRERGDLPTGLEGVDPLREGPESSVPWGRDRE
jgi:membrane protein YdbS with pleckstrin-like domain